MVPASTSRLIIVSGVPGSGKSTLGRPIAGRLGVPFLDKDDYLEDLFETDNVSSEERSELSRRADELMLADVAESVSSVVVSFWRRSELSRTSGTPIDRFPSSDEVVELWCDCPVEVAVDRFLSRRRHRAHGDDFKSRAEILNQFERLAGLGPLGVGRVVRVDTAGPVDVASLLELIDSPHCRAEP